MAVTGHSIIQALVHIHLMVFICKQMSGGSDQLYFYDGLYTTSVRLRHDYHIKGGRLVEYGGRFSSKNMHLSNVTIDNAW